MKSRENKDFSIVPTRYSFHGRTLIRTSWPAHGTDRGRNNFGRTRIVNFGTCISKRWHDFHLPKNHDFGAWLVQDEQIWMHALFSISLKCRKLTGQTSLEKWLGKYDILNIPTCKGHQKCSITKNIIFLCSCSKIFFLAEHSYPSILF